MACSRSTDSTTAFTGIVSVNTNISSSESLSVYTAEYQATYTLGARGAQTAAPWSSLNSTGVTYDLTMLTNTYFGLSALQGYGLTTILLNVPIIAITARRLPSDISANNFNDSAVKTRYRALLDTIAPYLNDSVKYFSLGNEVDSYFATHASEWTAYKELIEDARTYLKTLKPNILVGVTTTFEGATSTYPSQVASLNQNMDVIILTYYPINSSTFAPRDPSTVTTDFQSMATIAGSKPVVMQEWGYPSSTTLSSTQQKQSDFISNTFTAWKSRGSTAFPFISFFKRREWNTSHCQTITGQTAGQSFYEFMCSLGLLNNDSTEKTAYTALRNGIASLAN